MQKKHWIWAASLAATVIAGPVWAEAQSHTEPPREAEGDAYEANVAEKPDRATEQTSTSELWLSQLSLADRALQYARQTGNPESWLVAASLYQSIGTIRSDETGGGMPAAPETFWAEAEGALARDPAAAQRLRRYKEQQSKNLVGSNGLVVFAVAPASGTARTMRYEGGERAIVQMRDPRGEARLTVFDQNGAVACRTEWSTSGQPCHWTPRWTGAFRFVVERRTGSGPVLLATS